MEKSHYEFDFPGARAEFQKAVQLNPNSAYAHLFYSGGYLMPMGLRTEAIAEMQKAVELDPLSLPINNFFGETYELAGDYPAALRQYQHTIAMNPNFPLAHAYLAQLLELTGRFDDAIHERERAALLSGESEQESADQAARLTLALKRGGAAWLLEKSWWPRIFAPGRRSAAALRCHRPGLRTGRGKGPGLPVAGQVNGGAGRPGADPARG